MRLATHWATLWAAFGAALAAGAAQDSPRRAPDDWTPTWNRVREVAALERDGGRAAERGRLIEELESTVRRWWPDRRSALLAAELAALDGRASEFPPELARPADWRGTAAADLWQALAVLPSGGCRSVVATALIEDAAFALDTPALERLAAIGVEDAAALDFASALASMRALHARVQAAWSGQNLALVLHRSGAALEADALLAELVAKSPDDRELLDARALLAFGRGDERAARDLAGQALARGSSDAAVVLARLDLARGERSAALAGMRAALTESTASSYSWALRGWGVALLPGPRSARADFAEPVGPGASARTGPPSGD